MYSQEFIDTIKEKVDLVKLVSEYVELKKSGSNIYIGKCPNKYHKDSTPSFRVWEKEQSWACMSCHNGKKGVQYKNYGSDCIAFIQWIKNMSWIEAVQYLANKYDIPIPDEKNKELFIRQKNLCESYRYNLFAKNSEGYKYLLDRGLNDDDINLWGLGFDGKKITFPLLDRYLNVLGFTKRWVKDKKDVKDKYRNSHTSSIFNKRMYLYGINLLDEDFPEIRIAEGPMDVILSNKFGAKNVVATLGTAFTEDHARLIKHYNKIPVFCFDGDEAGLKAIKRATEMLAEIGVYSKILLIPNNKDLADLSLELKEGIETFIEEKSITYGYFLVKETLQEYQSKIIELDMKYYPKVMSILSKVPSQEEKNILQSYMKSIMYNRKE